MPKTSLVGSCEVTINLALNRISELKGKNRKALESEFKEWITAIQAHELNFDILYLNKIEM